MNRPIDVRTRVITCRGARAAERRLLDEIDRVTGSGLESLTATVRVVVPSRSLRRHLLRILARRRGALLGVQVTTLFGLALEAVARSGRVPPGGDAAFALLVRRLAAAEPVLRAGLAERDDGYQAVVGAVRDLLDAGFLPGNEEGVLERLDDVARTVAPERVERSRALVRLASTVFTEAEALQLERMTQALQLAEEAIAVEGPELLPMRALFVHGFADVTGVAADLLVTLVRVHSGIVILDRPPDPAAPQEDDLGGAYLSRLEERMAHLDRESDHGSDPPPAVELAEAPDAEAEARWVAERIRELLDRAVEPEEVGVVGRSLELMARHLRRHFHRLGVPFSGEGMMVSGAGPQRRLRRLADLLRRGPASEVDRWVETRAAHAKGTELLLGLRVLGVQRLADLASLDAESAPPEGVALPVAVGAEDEADEVPDASRRLANEVLRSAIGEARRLTALLERWPASATAARHRRATVEVLDALGWDAEAAEAMVVGAGLEALCGEFPAAFELSKGEWLKLIRDRLDHAGDVSIGGEGAGVQVLTVMESRARTFSHLFLVGVNRGVFPRVGHDDPMLPEAVRARLAADVLPEMPVKGRSADEERYLFAQLLSSAPWVSVSWHAYGAEGTMTPSPFVERLRLRPGVEQPAAIRPVWPTDENPARPRTAYELAVLAASAAGVEGAGGLLEAAVSEGRSGVGDATGGVPPALLAAARAELVREVERQPRAATPSPWFGFCGTDHAAAEETRWVTHTEQIATCPWRAFVERRLGVMPLPDPLLGLPGIGGTLVGRVVHGVLEAIVAEGLGDGGELAEVLGRDPVEIRWPEDDRLKRLVAERARRVAVREGLAPLGMAPLLAARAERLLEAERVLEWGNGALGGVLGAEVEGVAEVPGVPGRLAFRADRVDRDEGTVVFIDYKTAKPMSEAKQESTRRRHLGTEVARGRLLQAAAYAQAEGVGRARGSYLYLKPGETWTAEMRSLTVDGEDEALAVSFATAVRTVAAARAQGTAFPRLEEADGKTAKHCGYCPVAEACRRDDSTFRRHLVAWMQGAAESGDPAVNASRALWWLGVERPEDDG
jgi:hypothetical protein